MFDPFGIADGVNATIYLFRGRHADALMSFAGVIPFGDIAKFGKYAAAGAGLAFVARYGDEAAAVARYGDEGGSFAQGWLRYHDDLGGHALSRHVGKTDADLISRLQSNSRIPGASSFADQATAERVISSTISDNRNQVRSWLRNSGSSRLALSTSGTDTIGRGIMRGQQTVNDMSNARVVLQSTGNGNYFILTAFPE